MHTCKRCGSQICDLGKMRGALAGLASMEPSSAEKSTPFRAEVAQLAEHSPEKAGVDSSILSLGTTFRILTTIDSEMWWKHLPPTQLKNPFCGNPDHLRHFLRCFQTSEARPDIDMTLSRLCFLSMFELFL